MSAVFSDAEESLGAGLERQMNNLADIEEKMNSFKRDIPSLKRQSERFKTEIAALKTEIQSLKSERDTLRIEVNYEHDQNTHLHEVTLQSDLADQGRANRRIWVLEQENAALKKELEGLKVTHQEELGREVGISNGLRDRIGTLDEKRGKALRKLEEVEGREMALKGEIEALRHSSRMDLERLERELKEARSAAVVNVEGEKHVGSQSRVQVLSAVEQPAITSPRRALQKRPSNFAQPVTPTKTQPTPSHPPSSKRKRASSLSPASLSKRCNMVEDRYNTLKAEYDKLRGKYREDIKHWQEWKAADTARKEEKKKKKEMKKSTPRENPDGEVELEGKRDGDGHGQGMETVTLVPPSQESASASQGGSQRVTRSQAKKRKADDRSDFEGNRVAETIFPAPVIPSLNSDWMPEEPESQSLPKQTFIPPPPSQKRRITRTSVVPPAPTRTETTTPRYKTPQVNSTARRGVRVTPWLGGSNTKPLARTSSKPAMADTDFDPFNDEAEVSPMKGGEASTTLVPGVKTLLIRDRGEAPSSSLRRKVIARHMSTTEPGERSRRDSASPAPSNGSSTDSPLKRGLDMSDLTPEQVAKERKRISKMTSAEKKVLYAEYKGKGRYLRPDEVKTTVAEEFEIDPKQNNGLNYQYHDVQRGRAERKLMHGGDCECCTGYYEAVGPLPKYNAAPVWKDTSQGEGYDMTEAQITEHQNKVSRHRETWVRPPTPPGYWAIGFPNTQDVEEQNRKADAMVAEKAAKIRREAAHRDSKWKKKT